MTRASEPGRTMSHLRGVRIAGQVYTHIGEYRARCGRTLMTRLAMWIAVVFVLLPSPAAAQRAASCAFALEKVSRGLATGDIDNDGDLDLLVTNNGQTADLLRNDSVYGNSEIVTKVAANQIVTIQEGRGLVSRVPFVR